MPFISPGFGIKYILNLVPVMQNKHAYKLVNNPYSKEAPPV